MGSLFGFAEASRLNVSSLAHVGKSVRMTRATTWSCAKRFDRRSYGTARRDLASKSAITTRWRRSQGSSWAEQRDGELDRSHRRFMSSMHERKAAGEEEATSEQMSQRQSAVDLGRTESVETCRESAGKDTKELPAEARDMKSMPPPTIKTSAAPECPSEGTARTTASPASGSPASTSSSSATQPSSSIQFPSVPQNSPPTPTPSSQTSPSTGSPPVPIWQRLGPVTQAFSWYGRTQQRRPYLTQFFSVLVIYFLGDISAQHIGGSEDEYDPVRTARSMVVGGVASIPNYTWFMFLEGRFNYRSRILSLATKVLVNQIVFTPVFSCYFFAMHTILAGGGWDDVEQRLRETVPASIKNAWKLWPAVTAINFAYVPLQYRAIFAGSIAIVWQTYLSWLNSSAERAEKVPEQRQSVQALATATA